MAVPNSGRQISRMAQWGHTLADAILRAEPKLGRIRLVAIDGPSGSGKSTLAREIDDALRARGVRTALISTDDLATWDNPVAWWPELRAGLLDELAQGRIGRYRKNDWSSGEPRPGELITIEPPEVLLVEGVSSGRSSVRPLLSHLCWIEQETESERLEFAVRRDGEHEREHLAKWQRFEKAWFAVDDPRTHANTVLP